MNPHHHHQCNRYCRRHGCFYARTRKRDKSVSAPPGAIPIVPLFYMDQNQSLATNYSVTAAQADAMREAGRGRYINRGRAFQLYDRSPVSLCFIPSQSGESAPSISFSEMQANVGITLNKPGEPALRHVVDRVQKKIRAIGRHDDGTFDDKAPLAFGAWPGNLRGVYPADSDAAVKA